MRDVSFALHRGEILGFFGLIGAGRTEIMEMIFGLRPYDGEIAVDGAPVRIRSPGDAIGHGIGFVTEDRKAQGLVLGMAVRENFSLTHLRDYSPLQFVAVGREGAACADYVRQLGIKTPGIEQRVANLSGGNQQKVVIAKWVACAPENPDRGRADARHRHRRQGGGACPAGPAGRRRAWASSSSPRTCPRCWR